MEELEDSSSDGWKEYIADIRGQVEGLSCNDTPQGQLSRLRGISDMLETLQGSFRLYKRLQEGFEKGFTGAGHCELCAGCANSLSGMPGPHIGLSEDLLEEFRVSQSLRSLFEPLSNLYRKLDNSSESRNDAAPCVLACSAY